MTNETNTVSPLSTHMLGASQSEYGSCVTMLHPGGESVYVAVAASSGLWFARTMYLNAESRETVTTHELGPFTSRDAAAAAAVLEYMGLWL